MAAVASIERDDNLIGPDKPEVAAHEFVGHVRVGLAGIQQRRPMAQLLLLGLKLCQLQLPGLKVAVIANHDQRKRGPEHPTHQPETASSTPHKS